MIEINEDQLNHLSKYIVVSNTASFLWRKMTESSTIKYLAYNESIDKLIEELKALLKKEPLSENEQTKAYIYVIAILLRNRSMAKIISSLENADKLFWLLPLTNYAYANVSSNNSYVGFQSPIQIIPSSKSNNSTQTIRLTIGDSND